MKQLFLFGLILISSCAQESQDYVIPETDCENPELILYVKTYEEAEVIRAKFAALAIGKDIIECPDGFCFEVDEEDINLYDEGIRPIDPVYYSQIGVYCFEPATIGGEEITIDGDIIGKNKKQ